MIDCRVKTGNGHFNENVRYFLSSEASSRSIMACETP
jgi:hypothetical protein